MDENDRLLRKMKIFEKNDCIYDNAGYPESFVTGNAAFGHPSSKN